MGIRDTQISNSILGAIFQDVQSTKATLIARLQAFFSVFHLTLKRYQYGLFKDLRTQVWKIDEEEYKNSFRGSGKKGKLKAVGDLGYSGSTFFTTSNSKFLIKSLPRASESKFFANELIQPYAEHMRENPTSLLVRITDFLYAPYFSIGAVLNLAPPNHIIMENVLYGKASDERGDEWETYDLKPNDYFYPERDIANGHLAPESVKSRLIDYFPDKIRMSQEDKKGLMDILKRDTSLLASNNAIDYSLFLVRYPATTKPVEPSSSPGSPPRSLQTGSASPFRTGLSSSDGKWIYRLVVLDFFWAKHTVRAKTMTALVKTFNKVVSKKGPMSITTKPDEYQTRFMKMIENLVETS
ncbi:hypothetical protein BDY21DRAFT_371017 [Lineolata rhizophorae]|uniref:PIPK domain-containing protein n=1 Tax=Lineolata rhizophorae TaxID=578093 RepID=A0A6A6P280_9PEZI|nr:hypothetical protein BDY21DRAFT_371017 [Lineolata rhizophorae]